MTCNQRSLLKVLQVLLNVCNFARKVTSSHDSEQQTVLHIKYDSADVLHFCQSRSIKYFKVLQLNFTEKEKVYLKENKGNRNIKPGNQIQKANKSGTKTDIDIVYMDRHFTFEN